MPCNFNCKINTMYWVFVADNYLLVLVLLISLVWTIKTSTVCLYPKVITVSLNIFAAAEHC